MAYIYTKPRKIITITIRDIWEYTIEQEVEDTETVEEILDDTNNLHIDHSSVGGLTGADFISSEILHYAVYQDGDQIA